MKILTNFSSKSCNEKLLKKEFDSCLFFKFDLVRIFVRVSVSLLNWAPVSVNELPIISLQVENTLSTYDPHACVVVYSVTDGNSFALAEDIMVRERIRHGFHFISISMFHALMFSVNLIIMRVRPQNRNYVRE